LQRLDHQRMEAGAWALVQIAFLRKAETLVKAFGSDASVTPDLGRQRLCAGVVNERLKDLPAGANPARIRQDGHAANAPAGELRCMVARLRHNRTNADRLPVQEASYMQGARFGIAWSRETHRVMGSEDTVTQIQGFGSANGTGLDGGQEFLYLPSTKRAFSR
jgi:hypothetical protein